MLNFDAALFFNRCDEGTNLVGLLQRVAACCRVFGSVLQRVAVFCSVLQRVEVTRHQSRECVAVCCSDLHCIAVRCSAL